MYYFILKTSENPREIDTIIVPLVVTETQRGLSNFTKVTINKWKRLMQLPKITW